MPHSTPLRLLLALGLALVPAFAAKPKSVPADSPPQLISTKGGGPKWKNVAELQAFAANGDPQACFELGERSLDGDGVPKDATKAISLFETAAKGGMANAWFRLGKIYHDGLTGTPDYGWALEYFTQAARARVVEAQHNIGAMLVSARGVRRDYVEGLAWLVIAKQSGAPSDAEAQVRNRLAKRPTDIAAAEARAAEIAKDLPHATVRATLTGKTTRPPETPTAPPAAPVTKPVTIAPILEPIPPMKIAVPLPPVVLPGKQ
ncbi:MAG TPA: tetratricopeptide repeat protein [Lacunisphaera sp.]|jgi:TPR repeat protein|nr:sel1 repeat family protein [Lacunisphaera sp.]HQY04677.1 tetratricopeptide repeat protein [Lacunisphaera sp.]